MYHDYIIWLGDLNFRLEENSFTFQEIVQRVREGSLEDLLEKDQLDGVRRSGVQSNIVIQFPLSSYNILLLQQISPCSERARPFPN